MIIISITIGVALGILLGFWLLTNFRLSIAVVALIFIGIFFLSILSLPFVLGILTNRWGGVVILLVIFCYMPLHWKIMEKRKQQKEKLKVQENIEKILKGTDKKSNYHTYDFPPVKK